MHILLPITDDFPSILNQQKGKQKYEAGPRIIIIIGFLINVQVLGNKPLIRHATDYAMWHIQGI